MKKISLLIIVILVFGEQVLAQTVSSANKVLDESYDLSGKKFASNPNSGVEGSQMLNENWATGVVQLTRGKIFSDALFQFNLVSQQLFIKKDTTVFAFTEQVLAFTLNYQLKGVNRTVVFKNNYPPIEKQTNASFYQVLMEGKKLDLLKFQYKKAEERYEYNQPIKLVYQDMFDWYVFDRIHFRMIQIDNKLMGIQKILPDTSGKIYNSLQPKNKKHLSEEEMLQLFKQLDQE